jgi:hypothetical protein
LEPIPKISYFIYANIPNSEKHLKSETLLTPSIFGKRYSTCTGSEVFKIFSEKKYLSKYNYVE